MVAHSIRRFFIRLLKESAPSISIDREVRPHGFTLMEIMVTIIIIGILASLAIPNYNRTVELAHRNDATTNLMAIHAAESAYRSEFGDYWPAAGWGLGVNAINTNLGLEIIENGFIYGCLKTQSLPTPEYVCIAQRNPGAYSVRVTQAAIQLPNGNPQCQPLVSSPCNIN